MKLPALAQFRLCKLSDKELSENVASQLNEMYENGKIPSRCIPARPNDDFDLLLGELIIRFTLQSDIVNMISESENF